MNYTCDHRCNNSLSSICRCDGKKRFGDFVKTTNLEKALMPGKWYLKRKPCRNRIGIKKLISQLYVISARDEKDMEEKKDMKFSSNDTKCTRKCASLCTAVLYTVFHRFHRIVCVCQFEIKCWKKKKTPKKNEQKKKNTERNKSRESRFFLSVLS